MNYIQALKKPTHNKTFSYDYNINKVFTPSGNPESKILKSDHFQTNFNSNNINSEVFNGNSENFQEDTVTENNGNEADIDEEEKAKINRSFSVEILEETNNNNTLNSNLNRTPEKNLGLHENPSALFVGHLKNNSENKGKEKKKSAFMNFIDETINYFVENDKTTVPNNSVVSTKRKKMKNFHYSVHNDKAKSSHSRSQVMDEMNSIYVIQNQKLIKSKKTIEELKLTQMTLVKEIADHQDREKAYEQV